MDQRRNLKNKSENTLRWKKIKTKHAKLRNSTNAVHGGKFWDVYDYILKDSQVIFFPFRN